MRVNFFEEYPGEGTLAQADRIDFPSTIFLAAESVEEYRAHRDELARINPDVDAAYWATLSESYWVSPFADSDELAGLFEAAGGLSDRLLLDLELPVKRPALFARNAGSFFENRRRIEAFAEANPDTVVTAEYPPIPVLRRLYGPLGVAYGTGNGDHTRCPMFYTSLIPDGIEDRVGRAVEDFVAREDDVAVGLGTIATGEFEDEPILSPAGLTADLEQMAAAGASEVVVFRLGGLDDDYLAVLERFAD